MFLRESRSQSLFSFASELAREREGGSSAFVFRLGHFRYERPWLKDERRSYISHRSLVAKATPHTLICKA